MLVRLLHAWGAARLPHRNVPALDALGFARDADEVVRTGGLASCFYRPPLYIYLRASLDWLGLGSPAVLSSLQIVASALAAALLVPITRALLARAQIASDRATTHHEVIAAPCLAGIMGAL
ncbi:MAG TPA: hypothetical protein VG963_34015, partial [Polyangiaceae bacterium]|nr:hypothetical protein [Polyangiaceae bacterium]